jgi:murein DD-endopeptidase MepM/ murein hydrolase activator NlpD
MRGAAPQPRAAAGQSAIAGLADAARSLMRPVGGAAAELFGLTRPASSPVRPDAAGTQLAEAAAHGPSLTESSAAPATSGAATSGAATSGAATSGAASSDASTPAIAPASDGGRSSARSSNSRDRGRLLPAAVCIVALVVAVIAPLPGAAAGSAAPNTSSAADLAVAQGDPSGSPDPSTTPVPITGDGSILNYQGKQPVTYDSRALLISYTVKSRDTLGKIASKYGLAVTTVYWANKATLKNPQVLQPGQVLLIPPMDGLVVTVTVTDTLDSLAAKYDVAVQDIIDANNLPGTTIIGGQLLIIPGAETGPLPFTDGGSGGWSGRLLWPVPGHHGLTQRFGCTGVLAEPPFGNCRHYHSGIDVSAPEGATVVAAANGTVIYAGWKSAGSDGAGGGIVVWISHSGKIYSTYNHLSAEFVRVGQHVTAGQRIGSIGMTGNASGPHLHFEVWACYPWTGGTASCASNPLRWTR